MTERMRADVWSSRARAAVSTMPCAHASTHTKSLSHGMGLEQHGRPGTFRMHHAWQMQTHPETTPAPTPRLWPMQCAALQPVSRHTCASAAGKSSSALVSMVHHLNIHMQRVFMSMP